MTTTVGSGVLDPITQAQGWHVVYITGQPSPGVIDVDGIEGFDRETGWDIKAGKGSQGATLTLKSKPPSQGKIRFLAWLPQHFEEWVAFVPLLKYQPDKSQDQALEIYHPALADVGIISVVVHKLGLFRHVGRGKYTRTIEFIEWTPPPKTSIVTTPTRANVSSPKNVPGEPPDPIADAQQAEIAKLLAQAAAP